MNAHVGQNRQGGVKVSFVSSGDVSSEEANALLAALGPAKPRAEARPVSEEPSEAVFESIRRLSAARERAEPSVDDGNSIIERELALADRDSAYLRASEPDKAAGDEGGSIPYEEPRTFGGNRPAAEPEDVTDEREAGLGQIMTEAEIDAELEQEARAQGNTRIRKIAARAFLGLGALSVLAATGYAAYKFAAPSKVEPAVVQMPARPAPVPMAAAPAPRPAVPAQATVAAPPAPLPAPVPATPELTPAQRAMAGQAAPLPATLAKPPAAPLPPIESVKPVDAPPAPPVMQAPPRPAMQVGPISTRLAQITCRPAGGAGDPASLLISAGIWQAAASFNAAADDVAKWTGQQNGMVLFDANGRPDLSKIGPNLAVLAYANPGEQVASPNDANAKAWVVISRQEMKNADLGACTMRVIAPN